MKSLLKFLMVASLFVSTLGFGREIYCPSVVTCLNSQCTGYSKDFYISFVFNGLKDGTYYFYQAEWGGSSNPVCSARQNSSTGSPALFFSTHVYPIGADTSWTGNQWFNSAGILWCLGDDASRCPFYTNS